MLEELRVENLGVIDQLGLVLGPGLTAITGETGAGKTLLVEAIELLVGGRSDAGMVRTGTDEARVDGRFAIGDDEIILARAVPRDGRSRAYVDGRLAPAAALGEHGSALVDLHGQHAHQSLLASAVQRAALDQYAGKPALEALERYQSARRKAGDLMRELEELGGDTRSRARELDLLRFETTEIDAASIEDPDEEANLDREESLLSDAVAHREAAAGAHTALSEGAIDAVGQALALVSGRAPFAEHETRLRSLSAELGDVAAEIRVAGEQIADDPEQLALVRERRQLLRTLRRKYGETLTDVLAYRDEIGARLAALESYEERAATIDSQIAELQREADDAAHMLHAARAKAAPKLARAVTTHLRELAMPNATFDVVVDTSEPGADGSDSVTFLFSANAGEPPLPLAKVASGGELARTMLAARVVLSGAPPTLVFDEVDAGIGGQAGLAVGRKLARIAADHQVLCVTHLPQVAAFAHHQIVVSKQERDGRTIAVARAVEGDERVGEVARMLAGVGESATAHEHARELLTRAAAERVA